MSLKDLFAVSIGVMAVWFISVAVISLLAGAIGELAHLAVGISLLAVAGFVAKSGLPPAA